MNYKVSIEGWINNKCRLNFAANISGTNSSFANLYGVDPSTATILSFAPKIQCNFTKQQLEYVGDSILQEQERNHGATNNMLKIRMKFQWQHLQISMIQIKGYSKLFLVIMPAQF